MSDLRTLPKTLVTMGLVTTPPVDVVTRRARRIHQRRVRTTAAGALVLVLLATASMRWAAEDRSSQVRVVDGRTTTTTLTTTTTTTTTVVPQPPVGPTGRTAVPASRSMPPRSARTLRCGPGFNGGATDRGVTEDSIRVTMTETLRLPERRVTVDSFDLVRRLFEVVNSTGGICGRRLVLDLVNPVWGTAPWEPHSEALAGIGGPLDENFDDRIADGMVDRAKTPMLATGVADVHFGSPWVWPVLSPAASVTRIAVDHAYRLGARTFALVYEDNAAFGPQSAAAMREYVATLPGAEVRHVQAIERGRLAYAGESLEFTKACLAEQCDLVFLAMSAPMATTWRFYNNVHGRVATAGLPEIVHSRYVSECTPFRWSAMCDGLHVWTTATAASETSEGYLPAPCHGSTSRSDLVNSARVGACLLVEALRMVGPDVTRARVRTALDELTISLSLARRVDGRRVFDIPARALKPTLASKDQPVPTHVLKPVTDWIRDPRPGGFRG